MDIEVHIWGILPEIGGSYGPYMDFLVENMICGVRMSSFEGKLIEDFKIKKLTKTSRIQNGHIYNLHASKIQNIENLK